MSAPPYILARTIAEAHAFARGDLGLVHGEYRVVNTPSTLKSVRNVDLFLVPGWKNRFDRFAMQGAIRWTRMNVRELAIEQAEVPVEEPDGLEPAGVQLVLVSAAEATEFVSVPEVVTPDPAEVPDIKRRRSRCEDCGLLHFKDDPCDDTPLPEGS